MVGPVLPPAAPLFLFPIFFFLGPCVTRPVSKHFLIQRVSPFDAQRNCAHSLEEQSQSGSAMRRVSLSLQLTRAFILRCRADAMSRKSTGVSFHFKVVVMARVGWGGAECIITRCCVLGPGD